MPRVLVVFPPEHAKFISDNQQCLQGNKKKNKEMLAP